MNPFNLSPPTRIMVKVLIDDSTKKLNFFPAKNGIAQYYSPHMILHQRNLNYDKHCQYASGTYIQAHDEPDPSNTNAPAPWIAFIFDTMTMSKEAMIYCICK
jgi:hypothetical protein